MSASQCAHSSHAGKKFVDENERLAQLLMKKYNNPS
jgi:hypothetical protein